VVIQLAILMLLVSTMARHNRKKRRCGSREYKENIDQLRTEEGMETLQNLNPVKFSYKATPGERHASTNG
jgi:hypothetical protein